MSLQDELSTRVSYNTIEYGVIIRFGFATNRPSSLRSRREASRLVAVPAGQRKNETNSLCSSLVFVSFRRVCWSFFFLSFLLFVFSYVFLASRNETYGGTAGVGDIQN